MEIKFMLYLQLNIFCALQRATMWKNLEMSYVIIIGGYINS
jgi:hypothetical protein